MKHMQNAYTILLFTLDEPTTDLALSFLAGSQKKKLNYIICSAQKTKANHLLMQSSVIHNIKTDKNFSRGFIKRSVNDVINNQCSQQQPNWRPKINFVGFFLQYRLMASHQLFLFYSGKAILS